jgi:acetyltransferase-like isoleucine patch superfamily enzyme
MDQEQPIRGLPSQDPLSVFGRVATRLKTLWLGATYPFAGFGRGVSIHYTCDVSRLGSRWIQFGDAVFVGREVWLNVVFGGDFARPKIVLGKGCKVGRRSTLSARNYIELREDVLLAPGVLIMDHNHRFSDPNLPIHGQGVTEGGRIIIEQNCWLGHGSVIACGEGELLLGRNSVVGANSVVTKSFPAFSVVAGNPAKLIKRYDPGSGKWIRVNTQTEIVEPARTAHADAGR